MATTRSRVIGALLTVCLATCGHAADPDSHARADAQTRAVATPKLALTSDAFKDGQPIPQVYSCDGANHSPAIHWSDPPSGTKSFALVIDDPDAPRGTFRHWGVHDIPASTRGIAEGQHVGTEVDNDGGKPGYTGPCPPHGNGLHHYHFKLFALGVDKLALGANAKVADVENAAQKHALAQGELIGTYERK